MRRSGTQFDPVLVKLLVPFFGLYPPGTRLRLTTAEEVVIIEPNQRNITRPSIALLTSTGAWHLHWMAKLSGTRPGEPFHASAATTVGHYKGVSAFLKLLPDINERVSQSSS